MKRRSEHLVEKRDGRTEFLRATKLARSVHLALRSVGVDEDWRALEVTAAVLAGLRQARARGPAAAAASAPLKTSELADAVQQVLVAIGQSAAAVAYGATANERARRRLHCAAGRTPWLCEGPVFLGQGRPARPRERE